MNHILPSANVGPEADGSTSLTTKCTVLTTSIASSFSINPRGLGTFRTAIPNGCQLIIRFDSGTGHRQLY